MLYFLSVNMMKRKNLDTVAADDQKILACGSSPEKAALTR